MKFLSLNVQSGVHAARPVNGAGQELGPIAFEISCPRVVMAPYLLERAREGSILAAYRDLFGTILLSLGTEAKCFKSARSRHGNVRSVGVEDGTCATTSAPAR